MKQRLLVFHAPGRGTGHNRLYEYLGRPVMMDRDIVDDGDRGDKYLALIRNEKIVAKAGRIELA